MKTLFKTFLMLPAIAVVFSSCNDYGKKIKVEGTKGEVYYKGDGVTEADAKKTGDVIKPFLFGGDKTASTQIMKDGDGYILRIVYIKAVYDTLKGADDAFKIMGAKVSKEVFGGKKVNIALTDDQFKEYKTIPYDPAVAKNLENPEALNDDAQATYKHDTAGGVAFFWKDISDEESKKIADYIVKNGAFAGGTSQIYITKEGDRYMLKFPIQEQYSSDTASLAAIAKVSKEIKDNVFANIPYSFAITDKYLATVKQWDY